MVCDADVTLEIKDPTGKISTASTKDKTIEVNPECSQKKFTLNPDYETEYKVDLAGNYQMSLTAVTKKGTYNIVDSFEVLENADFDIERVTATRIFPYDSYPVLIKIIAKKDFSGQIKEPVPAVFTIKPLGNTTAYSGIQKTDTTQYIFWNISLKKGESINIGYYFNAPLISPQFYLLGPLNLVSGNQTIFEEKRAWQLAIDNTSYSSTILATSGLISYWRFGEASGTNAADSYGSNTGTYVGTPTLGVTGAITSDSNTAVRLNGTSQYVTVADNTTLNVANGPLSVEAWVKFTSIPSSTAVVVRRGTNAYSLGFNGGAGNTFYLTKAGSSTDIVTTSTTVSDTTTWHHIVATKTGATSHIYLDGQDVTTIVGDQTLADPGTALWIGANQGSNQYFPGSIDEVAVYNVVLTAAQVLDHYTQGTSANATTGNFEFQGLRLNGIQIK